MNLQLLFMGGLIAFCATVPIRVYIRELLKKKGFPKPIPNDPDPVGGPDDGPPIPGPFPIMVASIIGGFILTFISSSLLEFDTASTLITSAGGGLLFTEILVWTTNLK